MSWVTIEEAVKTRGSKASWKRWISSGMVPTKLEAGRRLVWLTVEPLERIAFELERHREERLRWAEIIADQGKENERLNSELQGLKGKLTRFISESLKTEERPIKKSESLQVSDEIKSPKKTKPINRILPAQHHSIFKAIEKCGLTFAKVERESGVAKRFLTKAKLGQRSGPRSEKSWLNIESYLNQLELAAA